METATMDPYSSGMLLPGIGLLALASILSAGPVRADTAGPGTATIEQAGLMAITDGAAVEALPGLMGAGGPPLLSETGGPGNTGLLIQQGAANQASVIQSGDGHGALLLQQGYGNRQSLLQSGHGNRADLLQRGSDNVLDVVQQGVGHQLRYVQIGDGLMGGGGLTVTQSGPGAGRMVQIIQTSP